MYQTIQPSIGNSRAIQIVTAFLFAGLVLASQTATVMQSAQQIILIPNVQVASPVELITELAVSLYVVAYFMPPALGVLANATFVNVDSGVVSIMQTLIPIATGLAIVVAFIAYVRKNYAS